MEAMTREQAIKALMRRTSKGKGVFSISGDEVGDARLLKRAVNAVGGVRQLAYATEVNREVFYNWLKRGAVPKEYRAVLERIVAEDDECED